ncbi:MAG: hypothetical protein EAZ99_16210 [Alphaproteobacteria bacterium]|nr:hypothetical protein [Alphaproteobacteria bacterium]TAD87772.1 MAG: hypothetical protein EAZ99_16210 [Alphaproteobacteria bacterium]
MWHLLHSAADRSLQIIGGTLAILAAACLFLAIGWHWQFSPFSHPGMAPDGDRLALLGLDAFRWGALGIAAMIAGVRQSPPPPKDSRRHSQQTGGWMVVPVFWLLGTLALAAISTVAWFVWMERLPGGNLTENWVLASLYAIPPLLLLVLVGYGLFDDRPEPSTGPSLKVDIPPPPVRRKAPPPQPAPPPAGSRSAQDSMAARRRRKGESDGWG